MAGLIIREAHFPRRASVYAYGDGGFRFADMSHQSSILCLPSGVYRWQAADPLVLQSADFERLFAEVGDVEILLVMGRELPRLPEALLTALKAARISADPMSTRGVVRTCIVLITEDPDVASSLTTVD